MKLLYKELALTAHPSSLVFALLPLAYKTGVRRFEKVDL